MIQGKVVRVSGYYRDPGFLEKVIATFRKLWVDIYWVSARRVNENNLYEVYLLAADVPNFKIAILNLSKTVEIEKVEVLEGAKLVPYTFDGEKILQGENNNGNYVFFIPVGINKIIAYSWGEKHEQDIHR
ncbi:MAG: ACT domain-containing protein [Sulfolobus sp.]|nr:ACT domain-containing protein [Sulfolobus sp.]